MTLDQFLRQVTLQVWEHGWDQLHLVPDLEQKWVGFNSPTGEWHLAIEAIRVALEEGGPRLSATDLAQKYETRLRAAVQEGERLRAAQKARA